MNENIVDTRAYLDLVLGNVILVPGTSSGDDGGQLWREGVEALDGIDEVILLIVGESVPNYSSTPKSPIKYSSRNIPSLANSRIFAAASAREVPLLDSSSRGSRRSGDDGGSGSGQSEQGGELHGGPG